MTTEAQRDAIAEVCGYIRGKWAKDYRGRPSTEHNCWFNPNHPHEYARTIPTAIPDYLNDLNMMHEAEKILSKIHKETMTMHLSKTLTKNQYFLWEVTAAQRAEAFLRTLNLWDDTK